MILFLGSGISLDSKLPSVSDIETELLKIKGNPRVLNLLTLLLKLDTNYLQYSAPFKYQSGKSGYTGQIFRASTTYEDLFYLVDQIVINGEGRKADFTVESFAKLLQKEAVSFLKGDSDIDQTIDLHKLANETRGFIEKTVSRLLHTSHTTEIKGLELVVELANSPLVDNLNIITLNHDTLVEQLLTRNNIEFTDGFGSSDGDVRYFEDKFSNDCKVRLIKIHGSISWWSQGSSKVLQPVIISDNNPVKWRNKNNAPFKNIRTSPSFLTGVSKVFSYNRGIFADQYYHFLQLLHSDDIMIMSGYGWGDIPINFQLQNWLEKEEKNKLILLHEKPQDLADISLELMHIYNAYTKKNKIIPIEKWLSETSFSELKVFLN